MPSERRAAYLGSVRIEPLVAPTTPYMSFRMSMYLSKSSCCQRETSLFCPRTLSFESLVSEVLLLCLDVDCFLFYCGPDALSLESLGVGQILIGPLL